MTKQRIPKFVYVACTSDNMCKIGSSARPYRRVKTIQSSCPLPLEIRHVIYHPRAEAVEGFLHTHFWSQEGKHIHGEWFRLTEQDIAKVVAKWPHNVGKEEVLLLRRQRRTRQGPRGGMGTSSKPKATAFERAVYARHQKRIQEGYPNLFQ